MFNKSNFCHIASNNRNEQKGSVFIYKTSDTLAQVTQSGYFNEKLIDINVHDLIIHVQYDPVARTLKKSVLIVTERTMDNVETAPILDQTIGDDIDQLGDQVQGIEEKIPENASRTNQLATKNQITDLQNSKQDKATAINYDNITNCITKIPQDIKLELNNGTLTLKAGSKIYVPNGSGAFNAVTIASDITSNGNSAEKYVLFVNKNNAIGTMRVDYCYSGSSAPTVTTTYAIWYDTTNNLIKQTSDNGSTWTSGQSFPFAIIINDTPGTVAASSIDQVFNGFGYIGSTMFTLPGVSALIPNGLNKDGSLKNKTYTTTGVSIRTNTDTGNGIKEYLLLRNDGSMFQANAFYEQEERPSFVENQNQYWYNPATNRMFYYRSSSQSNFLNDSIIVASFELSGTKIDKFTPNNVFHAVDYSNTGFIAHQAMPSDRYMDLTLGATESTYKAPDDGYVTLRMKATATNQYIRIRGSAIGAVSVAPTSSTDLICSKPVQKGEIFQMTYTTNGNLTYFRFIYANGAK